MPYVPSKKTDGKSTDREILDLAVEKLAQEAAKRITGNSSAIRVYKKIFLNIARELESLSEGAETENSGADVELARSVWETGEKYGYDGAFLGELNYSITRLIQRVPRIKVENGEWKEKDELRYWLYAATVSALIYAADKTGGGEIGINGVFEDIKDEYKTRMNTAYEAAQIVKSGDCYDGPYYTRLVEVVDEDGNLIGHQEVMLKRSDETLSKDVLELKVVLKKK